MRIGNQFIESTIRLRMLNGTNFELNIILDKEKLKNLKFYSDDGHLSIKDDDIEDFISIYGAFIDKVNEQNVIDQIKPIKFPAIEEERKEIVWCLACNGLTVDLKGKFINGEFKSVNLISTDKESNFNIEFSPEEARDFRDILMELKKGKKFFTQNTLNKEPEKEINPENIIPEEIPPIREEGISTVYEESVPIHEEITEDEPPQLTDEETKLLFQADSPIKTSNSTVQLAEPEPTIIDQTTNEIPPQLLENNTEVTVPMDNEELVTNIKRSFLTELSELDRLNTNDTLDNVSPEESLDKVLGIKEEYGTAITEEIETHSEEIQTSDDMENHQPPMSEPIKENIIASREMETPDDFSDIHVIESAAKQFSDLLETFNKELQSIDENEEEDAIPDAVSRNNIIQTIQSKNSNQIKDKQKSKLPVETTEIATFLRRNIRENLPEENIGVHPEVDNDSDETKENSDNLSLLTSLKILREHLEDQNDL